MKTTETPCKKCKWEHKLTVENPCYTCISNEDIALAHINPDHPVEFVHFEPKEEDHAK